MMYRYLRGKGLVDIRRVWNCSTLAEDSQEGWDGGFMPRRGLAWPSSNYRNTPSSRMVWIVPYVRRRDTGQWG